MTNRSSGQIITFYSYKGGTGRTMALANLACLLARPDPSRKLSPQRRVLSIDWDFEAPGLHRFLQPYLEPDSEKRFLKTPGCLELFQHLNSERVTYDPKDFVGNRKRVKSKLEALDLEHYLLATQFPGLFLMKAGLFDDDYSRRASEFDWYNLFRTTVGLFAGVADFLRSQFEFVLVDSRTGITDTSGICTMLLPDKLVVVFTPNQQSLTGIESLVRKAVSYRKGSPDGRPLTVFPLPSRVEMARPQLLEAWRNGGGTNQAKTALLPAGTLGYQHIFEQLFAQIYARQEISLDEYFNEVMLQHIPDYAYGEPIAVALETTESRISLSRSYEAFRDRLVELEVPWGSLKAARLERKIVRRCEAIADKLKEGAVEEAIELSFALIENKPSESQFDRSMNVILNVARAAYSRDREEASVLIRRGTRLALDESDLNPATVGQVLLDAGKLSSEFGDLTLATKLLKASNENFSTCFGAEHPTTLMVMNQLARIHQNQGDLDEARQLCQKSVDIFEKLGDQTGMADSYHQLGMLQQDQGDYEGARKLYQQSLEIKEKLGDLSGMADSYYQLGNLQYLLGDTYAEMQRYDEALADYSRAIDLDPEYATAYTSRGNTHRTLQQYELAVVDYSRAIELNPTDVQAYTNRGDTYAEMQRYDEALADYSRAIDLDPEYATAYTSRGNTHRTLQQYELAVVDYSRAIELNPTDVQAYTNRGDIYADLQQYDKALADYSRAVELEPKNADLYHARAQFYTQQENYLNALTEINQALELRPEDVELIGTREVVSRHLDRYDREFTNVSDPIEVEKAIKNVFIDRQKEIALFLNMIEGRSDLHILFIEAESGMGKSALLKQFLDMSEKLQLQLAMIDFKNTILTFDEFLGEICHQFGKDSFSVLHSQCRKFAADLGLTDGHTGLFSSLIDAAMLRLSADERKIHRHLILEAFFSDLVSLYDKYRRPFVMLFDTFERASDSVKDWMTDQFIIRIRQCPWLICVVCGQQIPKIDLDADWCLHNRLEHLSNEHVREYLHRVNPTQSEDLNTFITLHSKGHPSTLQQLTLTLLTMEK